MRILGVLLAVAAACWSSTGLALQPDKALHHYVRSNWSIAEGLPQISALALTQDRQGYLWVGTQAGLARFDGVRFTAFTPTSEPQLPGIWIRSLHTDGAGRLWIGSYKGAAIHDGTAFTAVPAIDSERWPSLDIHGFADDAEGTVWAATQAGLFRAQATPGGALRLHPVAGSPPAAYSLVAHGGDLWVGGNGAVHRYRAGRWQATALPSMAAGAPVNRLVHAQNRLWAATGHGLFVLEGGRWRAFEQAPELRGVPLSLLQPDRDGNLWVGGDVGLARIRDRRLAGFTPADSAGGVPGLRVAFEDREGNLWLGSQWQGVSRLADSWTRRYSTAEGLADRIVWSVAPDPDGQRIWIGSNQGVSVLADGHVRGVVPGTALPHPEAYNLFAEPQRLWIGTRHGLVVLDHHGPHAGQVRALPALASMADTQINGILRGRDGTLWIASNEGIYRKSDGRLRHYGTADGLADLRVRYLHLGPDGRVLAGTQSGLFALDGERFAAVGLDAGLPPGLDITAIHRLGSGRLLVGTLAEHLYLLHDGRWRSLDETSGMPANLPFFMTEHAGYLWLAGIRGISRVPLADLAGWATGARATVRGEMLLNERGDPMSGQQGYCCNGAGNAKGFLRGGTLWLPSRDGVVAMDTGAIEKNAMPPSVVIERMQVQDQWRAAHAMQGAELPAAVRDVSFRFTVLSFQDPQSNQLQYRLRGYDQAWQATTAFNSSARYTNLPPGDYVFEIRGRNNAGVASTQVAQLRFAVSPRFHETGWFLALLGLLGLALAWAGHHLLQRRHRLQRLALERLVKRRTEALATANARLREVSQTDPLTGLRNRRYMASQIPVDLAYYDRQRDQGAHRDEVMMFALVDVDHFKAINDQHGHRAGDLVLQQFAKVLSALVRTGDYVVRWGGEEFLLVFRPMPPERLATIGERIRAAIAEHRFDIGAGQALRLTGSVGLSEYPLFRDGARKPSWETMVELADQAMYYVKSHGRNGWSAFRPTPTTQLGTLLAELRDGPGPLVADGRLQLLGSAHVAEHVAALAGTAADPAAVLVE